MFGRFVFSGVFVAMMRFAVPGRCADFGRKDGGAAGCRSWDALGVDASASPPRRFDEPRPREPME